jgi:hypothetical protein
VRVLRLALLLALTFSLHAQQPARDFWVLLLPGVPVASGQVVYTAAVQSNYTFAPSLPPGSAFQFSATLAMAADPNPANNSPSQRTCAAPELVQLIASPTPPPFWQVTCDLGALDPGASASVAFAIDRKAANLKFELTSSVGPMNNDANQVNNVIKLTSSSTPSPARRRSVSK